VWPLGRGWRVSVVGSGGVGVTRPYGKSTPPHGTAQAGDMGPREGQQGGESYVAAHCGRWAGSFRDVNSIGQ